MMKLLLLLPVVLAQTTLQTTTFYEVDGYTTMISSSCSSSQYYDSSSQKCRDCGSNQLPDFSAVDALGDATGCKCSDGYYKVFNDCSSSSNGQCAGFTCTACTGSNVALRDQSACVPCVSSASYNALTARCKCSDTAMRQFLVEDNGEITCSYCPLSTATSNFDGTAVRRQVVVNANTLIAGKQYYADSYKCQACPDPNMVMSYSVATSSYSCECDSSYSQLGSTSGYFGPQACVDTDSASKYLAIESAATQVTYESSGTLVSETFKHYFVKSAANCRHYGTGANSQDCQALANLCVLQLYDDSTEACKAFSDIVTLRGTSGLTNSIINWGTGMPWLYVANGITACSDTQFRPKVTLLNYDLKYVVASYTLNGTFNGFSELDTLFTFCTPRAPYTSFGGGSSSSTGWQIFGATEMSSYSCDLDTLASREQLFYELYLFDVTQKDHLYPVPVRIVGAKRGGIKLNSLYPRSQCDASDMLVRRFMLFDMVSGMTSASSPGSPAVMRYASDIILETQISANYRTIKAPVLTIQYQESVPASWTAYYAASSTGPSIKGEQRVKYYFQGRYTMNMDSFQANLFGFFVAVIVFCGLTFLFRLNNWNVRQSRLMLQAGLVYTGLNLNICFEFVLLAASSWVYFFLPVHLLVCWYFFVFFKLQSVPATLLPAMNMIYTEGNPYFVFVANLHIMAFFQLFYCVVMIYRQSNVDIFFLDWQPPTAPTGGSKGQPQQPGRVSAWRTLFVANEWAELMTHRKTDISFSLFWIGFFLLGLGQEFTATQQPDVTNLSRGTLNIVLRFANVTWWWFVVSTAQYLWKFLFWERFISESPEQQFVDFCTIAKVSILVLDERYHGFYLHCRSPHQNADSSMAELVEMLHREEAGLTVDRSLEGGPKDVQTFQVFMSGEWRARFDKIYNALIKPDGGYGGGSGGGGIFGRGRMGMAIGGAKGGAGRGGGGLARLGGGGGANGSSIQQDSKGLTTAWMRVGNFLQEFVENSLNTPGLRRTIREATYFERFAGTAPQMTAQDQPCVFLPDRTFEYASLLFYGREIDLLIMNVLAYCLFDLWFGNTAVSILLTDPRSRQHFEQDTN